MTLKLTPHILAHTYSLLRATEPFDTWNLPPAEDVVFRVTRSHEWRGQHWFEKKYHHIDISRNANGTLLSVLETMAHEMLHVLELHHGLCSRAEHSRAFKKLAMRVCKVHTCFDPKRF